MANKFQKILYIVSNIAPALILYSIFGYIMFCSWKVSFVCFIVGGALGGAFFFFFRYGKKHLCTIPIHVSDITNQTPKAYGILIYAITCLAPFLRFMVDNTYIILVVSIIGMAFILLSKSLTGQFNLILLLLGYHFYSVKNDTGISGLIVISKKHFRKKEDLTLVKRYFEYIYIDAEDYNV